MSSKNTRLLSLGLCLLTPPCLSAHVPPPPNPLPRPQLYALGWSKAGPAPLPVPPCLHSYHQGLQCLEKEDWEMAVLFFSRALHLDSQLVRGWVWAVADTLPSLSLWLPGSSSRGHQVPSGY